MNSQDKVILFCILFAFMNSHLAVEYGCLMSSDGYTTSCKNVVPRNLTVGTRNVILEGIPSDDLRIYHELFEGNGWNLIRSLVINVQLYSRDDEVKILPKCFSNLNILEELHLHVYYSSFDDDCWFGLDNLRLLDLTNSTGVMNEDLMTILSPTILPRLRRLLLVRAGVLKDGFEAEDDFWKMLEEKHISYIDVSYTKFTVCNVSALINHCGYMDTFIARGTIIGKTTGITFAPSKPCGIRVLDISDCLLFSNEVCLMKSYVSIPGRIKILNRFDFLANLETLIFDNMCASNGFSVTHRLEGGPVSFLSDIPFKIKSVSFNRNNIVHCNIQVLCTNPSLEVISLTGNYMEYLNPGTLSCLNTLRSLDLSDNKLGIMNEQNRTEFTQLLKTMRNLENVSLAKNDLRSLPRHFFLNNSHLQQINLANNALTKINIILDGLENLQVLNFSGNTISVLDETSRHQLEIIFHRGTKLDITNNQFSCSRCKHFDFIKWLWNYRNNFVNFNKIQCITASGKNVLINEEALRIMSDTCLKPVRITLLTIVGVFSLVLVCSTLFCLRRKWLLKKKGLMIQNIIRKILVQDVGYEFAAFLSFSSQDEDISRHIVQSLSKQLEHMTGVTRDLVCVGDEHFRVGRHIHDEFLRCLHMSAVVIFIVTDNFCSSDYCLVEFDQAYHELGKPIILMIQENTNEKLMSPALKEIYKINTRIIWSLQNEEFKMKTSWENICVSAFELAAASEAKTRSPS